MHVRIPVAMALLVVSGPILMGGPSPQQRACELRPFSEDARFDQVFRKASHNSYDKALAPSLAAVLDQTPNIEIDLWDNATGAGGNEVAGNWYVRHGLLSGNDNNSTGNGGLDACLTDVRKWSDAHPDHEVITIVLDKKQGWGDPGNHRQPADLDALLRRILPSDRLFTPEQMVGKHGDLRTAAKAGAWPTQRSLRGRFVVMMTGGISDITDAIGATTPGNKILHDYVARAGKIAFVAPEIKNSSDVVGKPDEFSDATARSIVCYSLPKQGVDLGPIIRENGGISRTWGIPENDAGYVATIERCVNFVALDGFAQAGFHGGMMQGVFEARGRLHHHHKRGEDCPHGKWATDDVQGHHHHKRDGNCDHGLWATDDVQGHHHHKRDMDCEHKQWATDDQAF